MLFEKDIWFCSEEKNGLNDNIIKQNKKYLNPVTYVHHREREIYKKF